MNTKKFLSVILSVIMLMSVFSVAVFAAEDVSLADGLSALNAQFEKGEGPEINGNTIDYRYYSPVEDDDTSKYPLVVWLHGMGEGSYEGKQIEKNYIGYWTSAEFQSRFASSEGAFIIAARSPEEKLLFWDDCLIEPLRAAIDDFIAQHKDNIDLTRIYIGGFSMGGKMTLKMAVAYPEMFAAAFPICPAWAPSESEIAYLADMPVWLVSGVRDPIINYSTAVVPTWNSIVAASNDPSALRFSTLEKTLYPDGSSTTSAHHAWFAVTNDMFSVDNDDYPAMSTVDGNGEAVTLVYPDGMISWLSQFTSDYDGTPCEGTGNIVVESDSSLPLKSLFDTIRSLINKFIDLIKNFFSFMQ